MFLNTREFHHPSPLNPHPQHLHICVLASFLLNNALNIASFNITLLPYYNYIYSESFTK